MCGDRCVFKASEVSVILTAINSPIAVEDLSPEAPTRDSYPVILSRNRGEVADDENDIRCRSTFPDETDDAFLPVVKVNPLEAIRSKIDLVHRRFRSVEVVQIFDPSLNSLVKWKLKDMPLQALLMNPLPPLSKLPSHEHQLLSRMPKHISKQEFEIGKFLPIVSRHFPEE